MLRYDMKNAQEARFTIVQFQIKFILSSPAHWNLPQQGWARNIFEKRAHPTALSSNCNTELVINIMAIVQS